MVVLTDAQRKSVRKALMEEWSSFNTEVPIGKVKLLDIIGTTDVQIESDESQIVTDTTGVTAKNWLSNNPDRTREIIEAVANKRAEIL